MASDREILDDYWAAQAQFGPFIPRCPSCDRPISANKHMCRACGMKQLEEAAKHIRTTDELESFLGNFPDKDRREIRALVEPIMMARWAEPVSEVAESSE